VTDAAERGVDAAGHARRRHLIRMTAFDADRKTAAGDAGPLRPAAPGHGAAARGRAEQTPASRPQR
jgi:hypothetical protein